MIVFTLIVLFVSSKYITSQSWNMSDGILPWQSYIQLSDIQRPLGLTLNRSLLAHHHFAIGYFCLHSFMYDEAQESFNLAINVTPTFVEPYIGKMLGCKHALQSMTDFDCGTTAYNSLSSMLTAHNVNLTDLQSWLVSTVYQWYANQSSITAGEHLFLSSIANISQTYPNETDIRVLWGLSLLNVAYGQEFQGQMQPQPMVTAREVLITALQKEPNHPGALNYIIQAYDVAQINIAEQAIPNVLTYQNLNSTLSYASHLPALIWMRTGSMVLAKYSDDTAVRLSLTLCSIKLLNQSASVSSTDLQLVLNQLNTTAGVSSFLMCDAANRATYTERLSFTRLQTGNWLGTISSITDLYIAYNQSLAQSILYLSTAYRTRARAIVNLLYWLPYDPEFINRTQEVYELDKNIPFVALGNNLTSWELAWSEAGYRFSECLRLLIAINTSYNDPDTKSAIDKHLARFAVLSNQTISLNQYISTSISMMIDQIHGIIYYKNNSYQECLTVLNAATQREFHLIIDNNSPDLIFARSSELLAVHLLLIHRQYSQSVEGINNITFMLNGTQVSVIEFPQRALNLYQTANLSAPNRAINILGIARAYSQLRYNSDAARVYQMLINQITSTNTSDPVFSEEAVNFIAQKQNLQNSANTNQSYFSLLLILLVICILH